MKNFSLPVIAVNDMLMSESIASICCYSKTETGNKWGTLISTINVLNGGTIGSTTSQPYIKSQVLNFFGGTLPVPSYHFVLKATVSNSVTTGKEGAAFLGAPGTSDHHSASYTFGTVLRVSGNYINYDFERDLDAGSTAWLLSGSGAVVPHTGLSLPSSATDSLGHIFTPDTVGSWKIAPANNYNLCNHQTTSCPWVTTSNTSSDMHNNSTVPHALGGQMWFNSHKAQQYAS